MKNTEKTTKATGKGAGKTVKKVTGTAAKTSAAKSVKTKTSANNDQPIARLFRVMECMASFRTPTRLIDLAKKLNMSQSTVYRYVRTLCQMDYAYCDNRTGCYALTWKVCLLSFGVQTTLGLRSIAAPFLSQLSNTLNVSTCLVVMEGIRTSYLDYVDNPESRMSSPIRIGHNAPIHTSSSGKVLLSAMPNAEAVKIIDSVGLVALTPKTITDKTTLFTELEKIRNDGYAIDDEECETGQRCVSVPVYDYTGNVAAAISLTDITENMSFDRIRKELLPALNKVSEEISYRLGYSGKQ